jgi:hypothetical protein
MDIIDNLPPAVTLVLSLLLLLWLVLLLLVPFMIESIRGWSRRSFHELEEINRKLDLLTTLLGERHVPPPRDIARPAEPRAEIRAEPRVEPVADARSPREARPDRARKEPTL